MMNWVKDRISEPSSYAAVGVAVMGVGVVINQPILILFLKKKGLYNAPRTRNLWF